MMWQSKIPNFETPITDALRFYLCLGQCNQALGLDCCKFVLLVSSFYLYLAHKGSLDREPLLQLLVYFSDMLLFKIIFLHIYRYPIHKPVKEIMLTGPLYVRSNILCLRKMTFMMMACQDWGGTAATI